MASGLRSLPLLLFVSLACTQIIGLGELEKTDEDEAGVGGDRGGRTNGGDTAGGRAGSGGRVDGTSGNQSRGGGPTASGGEGGAAGAGAVLGAGSGGVAGEAGADGGGAPALPTAGAGGTSEGGAGGAVGGEGGAGPAPNCVPRELLVDGAFDKSSNRWIELSSDGEPVIYDTNYALSPPNTAWLGGYNGDPGDYYYTEVYQVVTVPLGTVALEAQCKCRVITDEPTRTEVDEAWLYLSDPSTSNLDYFEELAYVTNKAPASGWFTVGGKLDEAALADLKLVGAEVAFDLFSVTDDSYATDFFFDDCSLIATVCE